MHKLCFVSSIRINHFGRKPDSGGRPPRDNKIKGVIAVNIGACMEDEDNEFRVVAALCLRVRNKAVVIKMYRDNAMIVKEGAN